jgi:hypothetical protein
MEKAAVKEHIRHELPDIETIPEWIKSKEPEKYLIQVQITHSDPELEKKLKKKNADVCYQQRFHSLREKSKTGRRGVVAITAVT